MTRPDAKILFETFASQISRIENEKHLVTNGDYQALIEAQVEIFADKLLA